MWSSKANVPRRGIHQALESLIPPLPGGAEAEDDSMGGVLGQIGMQVAGEEEVWALWGTG